MATRYERGRDVEYKVCRLYEKQGWKAFRTAGSHGPVDVVAIGPHEVHLIQVKSELKLTNHHKEFSDLQCAVPWNNDYCITGIFMVWRSRKGWVEIRATHSEALLPAWLTTLVAQDTSRSSSSTKTRKTGSTS